MESRPEMEEPQAVTAEQHETGAPGAREAGDRHGGVRALWMEMRDRLDRGERPDENDLGAMINWVDMVSRIYDELAGDAEFEVWLRKEEEALEADPAFQAEVALHREAFLDLVRRSNQPG